MNVKQAKDDNKVILNVDQFGGEEIDEISFLKEEMNALANGETSTINGIRESGFWWADGDHIKKRSVVRCSK